MLQRPHTQWKLYRQAMLLTKELYRITETFPDHERTVLVYALRRSAMTLCQNLATATAKKGKKKTRLLQACLNACIAIDTQLELAVAVAVCDADSAAPANHFLTDLFTELMTGLSEK